VANLERGGGLETSGNRDEPSFLLEILWRANAFLSRERGLRVTLMVREAGKAHERNG
jgi:hypothetical protein